MRNHRLKSWLGHNSGVIVDYWSRAVFRNKPFLKTGLLFYALIITLSILYCTGCQERIDENQQRVIQENIPAIAHPVIERDLARIKQSGVLRMITFYNSRNYFIHKGGQAGFDYELVYRFAQALDLSVEVVVPEPGQDVISLLNSGVGDIVCAGITPEPELSRWVSWTRPTNFVQKVVVLPDTDRRPDTLLDLAGLPLTLPDGDPFRQRLQEIREESGVQFFISNGPHDAEAEELIARVSRGDLSAVVVDDITARAAMAHLTGLRLGVRLSDVRPTGWLVRENCPELKTALNIYLKQNLNVTLEGRKRRSQTYGIIYDRYFENATTIRGFRDAANRPDKSGYISKWDTLIRERAEKAGLDWRMVAALIYEESRFYEFARSKADARGLMQVMPQFAGPQADSLYIAEANMTAGLRLMKNTYKSYAYLDSLDRWRFTLAEYHAGVGHINDARRIAMDMQLDPNSWDNALVRALPMLTQRRHYDQTRHGFYGGIQTVEYVKNIINRYRMYTRLVSRRGNVAIPDSLTSLLPGGDSSDLSVLPNLIYEIPPPK